MTDERGADASKEEVSKQWEKADTEGRKLDVRQYPELNAIFYTANPSEFVKMRIDALSAMAAPDVFLGPVFAINRPIASMVFPGVEVPPLDVRARYIRTEAVAIVHHASEALLRLFFAHVDHPECPWLGMSASTSPAEFKNRVDDTLQKGFDRDDIARVFLGGVSREESGVQLTDEKFSEAIDATEVLLIDCGLRFLEDSFLYNAVKHGMTAIALDDKSARLETTFEGGEPIPMHTGPVHGYLHKKRDPRAKPSDGQWFLSIDDPVPDRDLAVASLIVYAIDSLWQVARRTHLGRPGQLVFFSKSTIDMAIFGPVEKAGNIMKRFSHELIKVKEDGEVDGTNNQVSIYNIPDEWEEGEGGFSAVVEPADLPVRPQDVPEYSSSRNAYLPFVPKSFQQGPE